MAVCKESVVSSPHETSAIGLTTTFAELQLNIAPAYPKEAGIVSWVRSIRLDRGQSVTVSDTFELQKESAAISQSLMTPCEVSLTKAGQLKFSHPDAKTSVVVRYEPPQLDVEIETIELKDEKLVEMWGPCLRRVLLKAHAATSSACLDGPDFEERVNAVRRTEARSAVAETQSYPVSTWPRVLCPYVRWPSEAVARVSTASEGHRTCFVMSKNSCPGRSYALRFSEVCWSSEFWVNAFPHDLGTPAKRIAAVHPQHCNVFLSYHTQAACSSPMSSASQQ